MLDQINGRILRFDPKAAGRRSQRPEDAGDVQANDLIVRKSDILVWDGSIRTLKAADEHIHPRHRRRCGSTRGGRTRGASTTRFAVSAFAQMGSQPPGSAADLLDQNTRAALSTKRRGSASGNISRPAARDRWSPTSFPNKGDSSVRIEVQTMDSQRDDRATHPARARTGWARWSFSKSTTAIASTSSAKTFRIRDHRPRPSWRATPRTAGSKASMSCRWKTPR